MSLLKLVQSQLPSSMENLNFLAAARLIRPLLRSPIAQVIISFLVGYYATTKIAQLYAVIRKDTDKRHSKLDFEAEPAADSRASQVPMKNQLPRKGDALRLTHQQLAAYDGMQDNQPIYTALNGNIYDLTSSRDTFLKPGPYSLLAGCNANQVLNITCASMGLCTDDVVGRWERSLNAEFNIIGYLIDSDASESDENENDDLTI